MSWTISAETQICGIIGDPVVHSMSPLMHNAAFRKLGLDYIYIPFRVKKDDLSKAVENIRALDMKGLNVTIPHKVAIISLLDELEPLTEKIGAVNTIVNNNGALVGYNTDAAGFLKALREKITELKEKSVVILGAGGASRAISFILAEEGAKLIILNRTLDRAKECADRTSRFFQRDVKALELNNPNLKKALEEADILVNTTSVGMTPDSDRTLVSSDLIRPDTVVFDIVYNPVKTKLLLEAEKAGAQTISGVEMLVWQGALAFEKWTGHEAPVDLMREEVIKALERHEN